MYALNDIVQVKVVCACQNQLGVNVLHYKCVTFTGPGPTDSVLLHDIGVLIAPTIPPLIADEANLLGLTLRRVWPVLDPTALDPSFAAVGTGGLQVLPKQVSGIITKIGVAVGRHSRGRVYVPFPSEDSSDTFGHPNAAYLAALDNYGSAINTSMISFGSTWLPVIYNRQIPPNSVVMNAWRSNAAWATQRRRGDYGRTNLIVLN